MGNTGYYVCAYDHMGYIMRVGGVLSLRHTLVSSVMLCSVADNLLAPTADTQHVVLVRIRQNAK